MEASFRCWDNKNDAFSAPTIGRSKLQNFQMRLLFINWKHFLQLHWQTFLHVCRSLCCHRREQTRGEFLQISPENCWVIWENSRCRCTNFRKSISGHHYKNYWAKVPWVDCMTRQEAATRNFTASRPTIKPNNSQQSEITVLIVLAS